MRISRTLAVRISTALGVLAASSLWACGLFETVQSEKVLAASIVSTPEYDLNALAATLDGGLPFDGGIPSADGGSTLAPQTMVEVFFGDRDQADPTRPPRGVAGATVKLSIGGKTLTIPDKGSGNYSLTSVENPQLAYVSNVDYGLTVTSGGVNYTASVKGPAEERVEQFHTGTMPIELTANTQLQLTRTTTDNVAFTTVLPLDQQSGQSPQPTWTNLPTKPIELFDLVTNDSKWKQKVVTIPGTAFPDPGQLYFIAVAAVSRGHTAENLFTTSVILAGTADLGLVKTK